MIALKVKLTFNWNQIATAAESVYRLLEVQAPVQVEDRQPFEAGSGEPDGSVWCPREGWK